MSAELYHPNEADEPPVTRRPEPQPPGGQRRAPLCPECWYLQDTVGHFWAHQRQREREWQG